ncbi:MAG: hypothetical protein HXX10_00085 [Rhodoplanes sp.]|uniref:PEP/pyruvate-binding domain-containing protein n=1 Tax=Rhodoplanes sp. TaxID=1968906 RepID=UPI0017D8B601|nr:PEP/pyruvate-binding domain-containing protein [Rhodoplanes sp.]NVO12413.1 hypothetical protein [Rhodoplanes sp.]
MAFTLAIQDIIAAGAGVAGGKGFALAQSSSAGVPMPGFFVVVPEALGEDGSLPPEAVAEIETRLAGLVREKLTRFAVRSSARSEDGAADSHAGQFLTVLDVTADDVPTAVVHVIRSGLAGSVADYRTAKGLTGAELPAVVVQGMVAASAAGVAFGADPVSGRTDRVVISAVQGLGDRLVAGEQDGETWRLDKATLEILDSPDDAILTDAQAKAVAALCVRAEARKARPQDIEWAFGPDGAGPFHLQDRPITSRLLPAWTPETKLTVLDNSNIVESYPGLVSPLTFSFAAMAYDRVYRAFLGMIGVRRTVIDAHAADLAGMLTLVDGRMYYNLGSWYRLLSLLPLFTKNRASMETMMGVSQPLPDEAVGDTARPGVLAALRMILGLFRGALLLPVTRARFMSRMAACVPPGRSADDLAQKPLSALAAEYRRIEAALLDRWDAPIVNDFLCMMAYGGSRRLMERWAGPNGLALHNDVMIGQGDIVSAEPARLIRAAGEALAQAGPALRDQITAGDVAAAFAHPALGPQLRAYIDRFGDRRIGELKLESPTLSDDPAPLLAAVLAASRKNDTGFRKSPPPPTPPRHSLTRMGGGEPKRLDSPPPASEASGGEGSGVGGTAPAPDTTLSALFHDKPVKRRVASALLAYTKARVRDRENLRFERTRIFGRARRVFLAMGAALAATGRVENAADVFCLTVDEVLGAAEGHAVTHDLAGLVALRKAERTRDAALPDPPERILLRGAVGDRSARIRAGTTATVSPGIDAQKERRGTPCGSGRARGKVRVIRDPVTDQLQPGEILVARHTDPGWIQHFVNAAAVVVERGSVLSHSAIVSRELGIPCVVALAGACAWLTTGEEVEVDGSIGTVRRIDA